MENESGTFETVMEDEPRAQVEDKSRSQRPVADLSNLHRSGSCCKAHLTCVQQAAQADVNGQVSSFVYDANDQLTKETLLDGTI